MFWTFSKSGCFIMINSSEIFLILLHDKVHQRFPVPWKTSLQIWAMWLRLMRVSNFLHSFIINMNYYFETYFITIYDTQSSSTTLNWLDITKYPGLQIHDLKLHNCVFMWPNNGRYRLLYGTYIF